MQKYRDTDRASGVDSYEISEVAIKIKFKNNHIVYVYTYTKPGQLHVEKMKKLASVGDGLNAYINTKVKSNFERIEY